MIGKNITTLANVLQEIIKNKCSGTSLPLGPKIIVLISEVSFLQGENMYLYKVVTQSSVLIKKGVLISKVS